MSKQFFQRYKNKHLYLIFSILTGLSCLTLDAEAKPKDKSKTDRSILVITIPFSPNSIQSQIDTLLEAKMVSPRRERLIRWFLLSPAWEQREGETGGDDAWVRFIKVKSAVDQAAKGLHEVRLNALMEVLDDKEHLIRLYRHKTTRTAGLQVLLMRAWFRPQQYIRAPKHLRCRPQPTHPQHSNLLLLLERKWFSVSSIRSLQETWIQTIHPSHQRALQRFS